MARATPETAERSIERTLAKRGGLREEERVASKNLNRAFRFLPTACRVCNDRTDRRGDRRAAQSQASESNGKQLSAALLLAANEKLAFFANSQFQSFGDGRPFLSTLISSLSALSFLRLITVPCSLTSQRASQSPADATSPSTSSSSSSSVQYGRSCHSHGHMLSTAYITDASFPINSQIGFG